MVSLPVRVCSDSIRVGDAFIAKISRYDPFARPDESIPEGSRAHVVLTQVLPAQGGLVFRIDSIALHERWYRVTDGHATTSAESTRLFPPGHAPDAICYDREIGLPGSFTAVIPT